MEGRKANIKKAKIKVLLRMDLTDHLGKQSGHLLPQLPAITPLDIFWGENEA